MSRIQTILDKAEREGTARRFRTPAEADGRDAQDHRDGPPPEPPAHVARTTVHAPFEPPASLPPIDRVGTTALPATAPTIVADVTEPLVPEIHDRLTPDVTSTPATPVLATPAGVASGTPVDALTDPGPAETPTAADAESPTGHNGHTITRLPLSPALVAALHPNALASEQFRTLRTRIANSANGRGARSLLLTSPGRGEGKSVMAANLALTMGQEIQQRVCLVDASLRDASVHDLFGIPDSPGLADVLRGEATLDEALVALDDYQLTILPAGKLPRHPAELLASREMRRILDDLRGRFDRVVIDAPPAVPMADVSILTPLVDGVLMVVRAGVTGTPALQQALGALDQNRVLGVVLNDIQG